MRWSVDTAEVRSARKSRHAVFSVARYERDTRLRCRRYEGGDEKRGCSMLAQDSFISSQLAQCLPVSFHV